MPNEHIRNTEGLKSFALKRQEITAKKVDAAIQKLIKDKGKINFNSVSEVAEVSKMYLYKNTQVRERIETLRKQQEGLPSSKLVKREMTDASKDVVIASKNRRIRILDEENKRLKDELMRLRGKIYDNG